MCIQEYDGNPRPWHVNTRLLSNEDFVNFVFSQIYFFIQVNKTPGISASLLWETSKAYLRWKIILFSATWENLRKKQLSILTKQIRQLSQLDKSHAASPSPDIYKERLSLQAESDIPTSAGVEDLILKSKCAYNEHGGKVSKFPSRQ